MSSNRRTRPNYFLSLPLGHNSAFSTAVGDFQRAIAQDPPKGWHKSINIESQRLHLTLGVLSLSEDEPVAGQPTLQEARDVLQSCQTPITELLRGRWLKVRLQGVGTFQGDRPEKCRVLYAVPNDVEESEGLLFELCDLIANRFGEAGLLSADSKGSELHATLLNTSHRKPRNRGLAKKPFDASGILEQCAEHDFGMAVIDELALCRMGSRDSHGLYVSAGTISFEPEVIGRDDQSD